MREEIEHYYKNLKGIELLRETISLHREECDKAIQNEIDKTKLLEEKNLELRDIITEKGIEKFKENGDKKLEGGLGIRVSNKLIYKEENAIEWANDNMSVAIKKSIDKKQFETYAKDNELDFVDKEEKITVTFPKELK